MTTAEILFACTHDTSLPFLVIGGLAVIAHGYPRTTVDLDYLTRRADREAWQEALLKYGYEVGHAHDNFAQFVSAHGWIDLDLMFVNDQTFDRMFAASELKSVGPAKVRFPSLEHLLALKLHVLKQGLPHRMLGDLDDIINLVMANRIDLREEKWRQWFAKYGNLDLYEKALHATSS